MNRTNANQTSQYTSVKSPYDSPLLIWALSIAFLFIWFYMLGARTLVPTDEGRYAEMAREMLVTGDWLTPRLNGIKYFEKPPLQAWMNVITFEIFGLGDWQARLWTGLSGLLSIALVGYTGAQVFSRRIGMHAAIVLGSSLLWAASSHYNSLDMAVASMMSITLCGLLISQQASASQRLQRNGMLLCWFGMALAVLTKGLIGLVLPGAVLIIYTLLSRDWSIWKRLHMGKGLVLFFAIVTPWFILVALQNPEHPQFFFIHEHLQRFTSKIHKRYQPAHFFVVILALGILPWLGVLLQSVWNAGKREGKGFQTKQMLLVWSVFIFIFFSISNSKLTGYILPIFPSLALLIACQLEKASVKSLKFAAALLFITALAGLALSFIAPGKINASDMPAQEIALSLNFLPWLYVTFGILLAGSIAAYLLAKKQPDWSIISLAGAGFLAGQLFMLGYEPWGAYRAGTPHVKAIQAELSRHEKSAATSGTSDTSDMHSISLKTPIYSVGIYEQCLPFYLGRTLILVEHSDELSFGLQQQPELWIPKRSDFSDQWRAASAQGKAAIAFIKPTIYQQLRAENLPMRIIAEDSKRIIVSSILTPSTGQ